MHPVTISAFTATRPELVNCTLFHISCSMSEGAMCMLWIAAARLLSISFINQGSTNTSTSLFHIKEQIPES